MHRTVIIAILAISMLVTTTVETKAQEAGTWVRLPTNESINALVTTPFALYGGQYATKSWYSSYNGVYKSKNLGTTWVWSGLMNRGIKDLAYDKGIIYACTYYVEDGTAGLFASSEEGINWQHLGPNYACTKMAVAENSIILGTKYNGIWVSKDGGANFTQTLQVTGVDSDIVGLKCMGSLCFASTYFKTYKSTDSGSLWTEIPQLAGKIVGYFAIYNKVVLAGTNYGLYRSTDSGNSWNLYAPWEVSQLGNLIFYNKTAFAAKKEKDASYRIYRSKDFGLSWENTGMVTPQNIAPIAGFTWLYAKPAYLFAASFGIGVQRYAIETDVLKTLSFLGPLWKDSNSTKHLQSITSYFDHSYPLLAYPYKSEPEKESDTTTNFLGDREKIPNLYYSSHDGVDFGLNYGTPILAPASGYALYSYTVGGGNTVKIDHQNGYQTQYLHLQKEGLFVTTENKDSKWIDKGQQVGLVGLTGNTTGPHLHFAVRYDKNNNGNFLDDAPDGRVDPYAWQNDAKEDPWEVYSWIDALGSHIGSESAYLWGDFLKVNSVYLSIDGGSLSVENATVILPENTLDKEVTLSIQNTGSSNVELVNQLFKYIHGTALLIKAYDNIKNQVSEFTNDFEITFDLSQADFSNIATETLKIMYFDPNNMVWNQIATMWDEAEKNLTGFANHLSEFAVFGEKIDADPPITTINIVGQKDGDWYTESPMISLTAMDGENESGVDKTFYSLDGGDSWKEYLTQTQVVKEGVYAVLFRSADKAENYEPTQDSPLLRVDTFGLFKDEIALSGTVFTIATE